MDRLLRQRLLKSLKRLRNPADLLGNRLETISSNTLIELENFWPIDPIYAYERGGIRYIGREKQIIDYFLRKTNKIGDL